MIKHAPTVSVCIVTFNSSMDIEGCLRAVLQQTWPLQDIIIVDNASSDHTTEIINQLGFIVRLVCNQENIGFAAAQNQAISLSTSDYVLVLNPDVVLDHRYIEELVSVIKEDSTVGSATGCLLQSNQIEVIDSTGISMSIFRRSVDRGAGQYASNFHEQGEIFGVSGAAALYSRKFINHISVGGQFYDEDFFAYKEDVDVAWRGQNLGWRSRYVPKAIATHARGWGEHTRRKSVPVKIRRHSYVNRYLMIIKNEKFDWRWWMRFPLLIGYEALWNGYVLVSDPKSLGSWKSMRQLIPHAIRKRNIILNKLKEQ